MALILLTMSVIPSRADLICVEAPYPTDTTDEKTALAEVYADIIPALERFPEINRAIKEMTPALCLSDVMNNAHGYFDADENRIVISDALPKELQVGVLLHELRHLWQSSVGACPTDALDMKEYARATYAIEADASAVSLLIAWSMKEHGRAGAWSALSSWPRQADIAESFAKTMRETGDAALATTAAFYQWYASEARRDQYYYATCSDYLDRQDESHLIPQYQTIEAGFYKKLCRMPDGRMYQCTAPLLK